MLKERTRTDGRGAKGGIRLPCRQHQFVAAVRRRYLPPLTRGVLLAIATLAWYAGHAE